MVAMETGQTHTWSGLHLDPVYEPEHVREIDYETMIGPPGSFPFTRGKYQEMYRTSGWISRNLAGLSSAADTNSRLQYLLEHGGRGLAVVPDTATQMGLDYDHPYGRPLVGLQGVPLASKDDMRAMCEQLDLERLNASFSTFQTPVAAHYFANAIDRGYSVANLRGSIQNDPICARLTGYDPGNPLDVTLRMAVDAILYGAEHAPRWHSTVVNTYILREAGTDAFQEMAIGLEVAFYYMEEAVKRGMNIDQIAPRFAIIAGLHNDFFEEIAKLRATRRIWANEIRRRFGSTSPGSEALTISVHTCGSTLTASDPVNNIVRSAYQALAAVLGGCRGLDLSCYDEPFSIPSVESATVAMRTHAILQHETGVGSVADPLGGSYYMERLTTDVEGRIRGVMASIKDMGGLRAAHDSGWLQDEIDRRARMVESEIDDGSRQVVGVNVYEEESPISDLISASVTQEDPNEEQFERLVRFKEQRDRRSLADGLEHLTAVARSKTGNVFEAMVNAVSQGATTGEVTGAVRIGYGEPFDPLGLVDSPVNLK